MPQNSRPEDKVGGRRRPRGARTGTRELAVWRHVLSTGDRWPFADGKTRRRIDRHHRRPGGWCRACPRLAAGDRTDRTAAEKFGWDTATPAKRRGRGFGFARYKNYAAYCAVAAEVDVEHETGRTRVVRVHAAIDSGQAINPDGIVNQTEGGIVQATSWTLHEAVAFEPGGVTSRDWASYPIIRFSGLPDSVDVHVIDRPGEPFLGTGEAAQGPTAAAIANAVANATGVRIRELPLTSARVKAAIGT